MPMYNKLENVVYVIVNARCIYYFSVFNRIKNEIKCIIIPMLYIGCKPIMTLLKKKFEQQKDNIFPFSLQKI